MAARARPAALMLALAATVAIVRVARGSSGDDILEPNGRGVQLLGGREQILLEQSERARRAARARALALYRLLRVSTLEADGSGVRAVGGAGPSARAIVLATAVLARDLQETRVLRGELDRVRADRAALRALPSNHLPSTAAPDGGSPFPGFLPPVPGTIRSPFGVRRDPETGAWIFSAAATFATAADEPARCPFDGRVVRVAGSVAGGAAAVITQESGPWTVVLSGLDRIAVAPGESIHRGDLVGRAAAGVNGEGGVRVELWRGRAPVDPAAWLAR